MEAEDPWDWSVDRVVQELCTPNRTWEARSNVVSTPDPTTLENALREQEVTGSVLLTEVDDTVLRNDFGIKILGRRAFIREAINVLQSKSQKYMQDTYRNGMANSHRSPSVAGSPHSFSHYPFGSAIAFGQPHHYQFGAQGPFSLQHPLQSPGGVITPQQFLPFGQAPATPATPGDDRTAQAEFIISDSEGIKRRKLDLTIYANHLALQPENGLPIEAAPVDQTDFLQDEDVPNPPTSSTPDFNGKKRKRIAPTLITSEIDPNRNRDLPTEADDVVHNIKPPIIEPGVVFIGEHGRKRIMPVHQQTSDSEVPYDYDGLVRKRHDDDLQALDEGGQKPSGAAQKLVEVAQRKRAEASTDSLETGYLGKKKMLVDDVFYEGTEIGDELSSADEGLDFFENQKISTGRRLYVNSLMRHFFNSKRDVFARDGTPCTAVRPYSLKLAPTYHNPSFTLFTSGEAGGIIAKRAGLRAWPEINPEAPSKMQTGADINSAVFNELIKPYGHSFDTETLRKWDAVSHGDEVLPLYGESDEENEFDDDTWKEIEDEQGTLEKPLLPLKKPALSVEQVNEAIDEGIAELIVKWNKYQLPKKQRKAFKIWKLTRHREAKRAHIDCIEKHLNRTVDDRIPKLRKEIASEVWTSHLQVLKQTRSMEQSIFDREADKWEINIAQSPTRPEKPLPRAPSSKKSITISDDGEDGETLGSDTEASSSDEDLGDFIVDDTPSDEEENELNLADSEADLEDTEALTPPKNTRQPVSLLKKGFKESIEDDDLSEIDGPLSNAHDDTPMSDASINRTSDTPQGPSISNTPSKTAIIKEEQTLPKLPTHSRNDRIAMIDLTMLSSDDNSQVNLVTPKKKKPLVSLFNRNSPFRSITPPSKGLIVLSDGDEPQTPDQQNLPSLKNPAAVAKFSTHAWAKISDRRRLLITMLHAMVTHDRDLISKFLADLTEAELWNHMEEVMGALSNGANNVKGLDQEAYDTLIALVWLFYCFVDCKERSNSFKVLTKAIPKLKDAHDEWFPHFYRRCLEFGGYFKNKNSLQSLFGNDDDEEDEGPRSAKRRRPVNTSDNDDSDHDKSHSKRKKPVYEDAKARDLREQDKIRQKEQDERRKTLHNRLAMFGTSASQHDIIINYSKFDDQGFICVNDTIARRIKPHQVEGVRFMWNQIVTQDKELQGCLLAHTMGLGKTMQVITLLVAIAESSRSTETSIYSQIPLPLRASKTLILCPPTLIDNWMDELLMWTANKDVLGEFRKVDSSLKPISKRLDSISAWYHDGGILVMGYDGFRMLIDNKRTETRAQTLTVEQHNEVSKQLLEGPNIIVADEAHKMKNAKSAITKAAVRFRSQSRIALTGSPLANNVAEYHTMIDWVAPNYLGPAVEFRAKYVEPIQQGLWHDSDATERRKSLKMLGVLKVDLAPKVHRADMSVLRNDLPPKKEFVITVPLTDLQSKAYTIYVRSMVEKSAYTKTKDGEIASATLWHWLAILSLLCNHPKCFDTKLKERKEDARKELGANEAAITSRDNTDQEEVLAEDLNTPIWKVGVSQELINEVASLFTAEAPNLEAINLSNKVKILCQILDASKAIGDKVLIFSQSLPTLNYLEQLCKAQNRVYARLDGKTKMDKRQELTRKFNSGNTELYLISTAAGGLGLNLPGANRVIIFDFKFNPIQEEQAVGRAYRIGQRKPVFVYRFVAGGTFESSVHNKTIFKMQLASRVVDKKNPIARASKKSGEFLFEPKPVEQMDLSEFEGMDPGVLDRILATQPTDPTIRGIVQSDTFERDDEDRLTSEEQKEVDQLVSDKQLERSNPTAYYTMLAKRQQQSFPHQTPVPLPGRAMMPSFASPYQPSSVQNLHRTHQNAVPVLGLPVKWSAAILPGAQAAQPVQQGKTNGNHSLSVLEGPIAGSLLPSTSISDAPSSIKPKSDKKTIVPFASRPETDGADGEKVVATAKSASPAAVPSAAPGLLSKKAKADGPKATDSSNNIATVSPTPLSNAEPLSEREKPRAKATGAEAIGRDLPKDSDILPSRGRSPIAGVNTKFRSVTPENQSPRDHRKGLLRRTNSVTPAGKLPPKVQSPSSPSTSKSGIPFSQPLFEVMSEGLINSSSGSSKSSRLARSNENRNTASKVSADIVRAFMKYLPDDKERNVALQAATTALASSDSKCRKLADGTISFDKFARRYVGPVALQRSAVVDGTKDIQNVCKASYYIPPFKKREIPAEAKSPNNNDSWPWQLIAPYRSNKPPLERRFKSELQEFLKARGLNCEGSRAELISRVQARRNKFPIINTPAREVSIKMVNQRNSNQKAKPNGISIETQAYLDATSSDDTISNHDIDVQGNGCSTTVKATNTITAGPSDSLTHIQGAHQHEPEEEGIAFNSAIDELDLFPCRQYFNDFPCNTFLGGNRD